MCLFLAKFLYKLTSHTDAINAIEFCKKSDRMFLLIASADCTVSLHEITGEAIGIFGQEAHWRIESSLSPSLSGGLSGAAAAAAAKSQQLPADQQQQQQQQQQQPNQQHQQQLNIIPVATSATKDYIQKLDLIEQATERQVDKLILSNQASQRDLLGSMSGGGETNRSFLPLAELSKKLTLKPTFEFEKDAFVNDTSLRYNPWSETILGQSYQDRSKKRARKQIGIIQGGSGAISAGNSGGGGGGGGGGLADGGRSSVFGGSALGSTTENGDPFASSSSGSRGGGGGGGRFGQIRGPYGSLEIFELDQMEHQVRKSNGKIIDFTNPDKYFYDEKTFVTTTNGGVGGSRPPEKNLAQSNVSSSFEFILFVYRNLNSDHKGHVLS